MVGLEKFPSSGGSSTGGAVGMGGVGRHGWRHCHSALGRLAVWVELVCSGKARNDVMGRFGLQQQETTECLHWLAEPRRPVFSSLPQSICFL